MRLLVAAWMLLVQSQSVPPAAPPILPEPKPPAEGAPSNEAVPPQTPKPPAPEPLINTGKPMKLEGICADAEIADFGLTCDADDPCPVYLELSTVESLGTKIFIAGNFHTESTTLWSLLLASDDNGQTWTEPFPRIRSAVLDQLQFADFETGWASGHLALALPRDPFLLKTTDGGKTWRRQPLADEYTIAVIEQFHFDNRNNGSLILDRTRGAEVRQRYQKLETTTGGDVWTLREATMKSIPGKRVRGATSNSADWRLRADAAKAYRVEHRVNAKWTTVATFALVAGGCKPAPPPPPPPPSVEPPSTPPPFR